MYYAVVVRHPYGKTPPLPVCEFISSSHDQYAIGTLRAIHEKEFEKYKHTTNPRLILMDFSWAIILACVREFCGENIIEYVNRTKRIVEGNGSEVDISKSLLHICAAHIMKAAKSNILTKYCTTLNKHSQVHFAMRSMGRLINCKILSEAVEIVKWLQIIMTTEYVNHAVITSLQYLENSINTFQDEVEDGVELKKITESSCMKTDVDEALTEGLNNKEPSFVNNKNDSRSLMHDFWQAEISQRKDELSIIPKTSNEKNRYFMPNFFTWLEAKLPFITLWSNLCLGDLRRFNSSYNFKIPSISGNTFLTGNRTNASAEQFFNMKKANKSDLGLPLNKFIKKCWEDNKGLLVNFILSGVNVQTEIVKE